MTTALTLLLLFPISRAPLPPVNQMGCADWRNNRMSKCGRIEFPYLRIKVIPFVHNCIGMLFQSGTDRTERLIPKVGGVGLLGCIGTY